jgi:hypothetical protein
MESWCTFAKDQPKLVEEYFESIAADHRNLEMSYVILDRLGVGVPASEC